LRDHKKMHPDKPMDYEGDLEADYMSFLRLIDHPFSS